MISEIFNILKSININAYYQECTNKTDEYVVYSIYQEKDTEVVDNKSRATLYYITINYCYKKGNIELGNKDRYKEIKKIMKSNGFGFDGCVDVVGETHFGKNMDFKIEICNED